MKRGLFNALSATSLLLFIATAAIWIGTYRQMIVWHKQEFLPPDPHSHPVGFVSVATRKMNFIGFAGGELEFYYRIAQNDRMGQTSRWQFDHQPVAPDFIPKRLGDSFLNYLGFKWILESPPNTGPLPSTDFFCLMMIPLWLIALLCTATPLYWLRAHYRRKHVPGHCPTCGYDLRATPTRCPECGTTTR